MNSTLRQTAFRSIFAVSLVLLPLCCSIDTKAQQGAAPSPASGVQNLRPSVEVEPATEKGSDDAAKDAAENPVAAAISVPLPIASALAL